MVGIDSSPAMLARAAAHARTGLRFEPGDLAAWSGAGDVDLVLANASLQWVPDHPAVLARWTAGLAPGGQVAVQVPANSGHPSHRAVAAACLDEPFRSVMGGEAPVDPVATNVLAPEAYAEVLDQLGFAEQHVRLQVYGHHLDSSDDVVEWVRGTTMNRVFVRLPAELHEPFVDAVRRHLEAMIGRRSPYFYAFRRILLWGRRERP
jgi:trans-aconitate 2-methyltransferase